MPLTNREAAIGALFDTLVPSGPLTAALVAAYEKRYANEWTREGGAELEAKHPGILAATMKVGAETHASGIGKHLPRLKQEYVNLAGARLTDSEVREFAELLSSPSGRKLMSSILSSLAGGQPTAEARTKALAALKENATEAEIKFLTMFSDGLTAKKLLDIRVDFRPLIATWATSLNTEINPLIEKNVGAASAAFVSRKAPESKQ